MGNCWACMGSHLRNSLSASRSRIRSKPEIALLLTTALEDVAYAIRASNLIGEVPGDDIRIDSINQLIFIVKYVVN